MKFVGFFGVSEKRLKGRKTRKIFSYVSFFRVVSELSEKEKNLRNLLHLRKSACREAAITRILVQRLAKFQISNLPLRSQTFLVCWHRCLATRFFLFPKGDPGTTANESLRDAFGIQNSNYPRFSVTVPPRSQVTPSRHKKKMYFLCSALVFP